jgi:hypothetical protein
MQMERKMEVKKTKLRKRSFMKNILPGFMKKTLRDGGISSRNVLNKGKCKRHAFFPTIFQAIFIRMTTSSQQRENHFSQINPS